MRAKDLIDNTSIGSAPVQAMTSHQTAITWANDD